ncbi:MAG: hypothetical protein HRT80_01025 [Henriciella sp.]|nr:hypothetical protein [Henriciella sp.]
MNQPSITDTETLLGKILPPKSVLALGALMPQRLKHISNLGAPSITLVHSDDVFLQQISDSEQTDSLDLEVRSAVISATGDEVSVFKNSIDRESGLIRADDLRPLWKNLEQISETRVPSVTLPEFTKELETKPNWLILDRLDGLPIIKNSTGLLGDVDVIYMRANSGDAASELSSSEEAISVLGSNGFELIARGSERHPDLETLLFARNCGAALARLTDLEAELEAYREGKDSDAEKRRKIAQNNLSKLEERYSALLAKNKKTEKLVADILERLSRAETALGSDE